VVIPDEDDIADKSKVFRNRLAALRTRHEQIKRLRLRPPRQASLDTHRRIHTGKKTFVCPRCDLGFRLNRYLRGHVDESTTTSTSARCCPTISTITDGCARGCSPPSTLFAALRRERQTTNELFDLVLALATLAVPRSLN
jgi:uncharacterized Zn-finger protein